MRYKIRINKRVRSIKSYVIVKKIEGNPNIVTKLFMKLFSGTKKEESY